MATTIGYTSSKHGKYCKVVESTGEHISSTNVAEILAFISEDADGKIKVAWDLTEFIRPIVSMLPVANREQFAKSGKTRYIGTINGANYMFELIFNKPNYFGLKFNKTFTEIFNLSRFYLSWPEFYQHYLPPSSALEVKAFGDQLIRTLNTMGFFPSRLVSPASVYKECMLDHMDIPDIEDIPDNLIEEVNKYVIPCCDRPWISAYKIGHWHEGSCYDYDLTAAYQSETSAVLSTKPQFAEFTVADYPTKRANWGYMWCDLDIQSPISPIVHRLEDGTLINPSGRWRQCITLEEARHILKYRLGTVRPIRGLFIHFKRRYQPFQYAFCKLYEKRQSGGFPAALSKQMGASAWGKFLEEHQDNKNNRYGDFFNPFYGAQIPTNISLRVNAAIYDYGLTNNLLHVATDGFLTDAPAIGLVGDKGMGKWRLSSNGGAIVLSPSLLLLGKRQSRNINYDNAIEILAGNPTSNNPHPAISFEMLKAEQDRAFKKFPKNGRDLLSNVYDSEPHHI